MSIIVSRLLKNELFQAKQIANNSEPISTSDRNSQTVSDKVVCWANDYPLLPVAEH